MARLFQRGQFIWIEYRDPERPQFFAGGRAKPFRENTGFRHALKNERIQAEELRLRKSLAELRCAGNSPHERWDAWVIPFLEREYATQPRTLLAYKCGWRNLKMFLVEHDIALPRQLTFSHCENYFAWRERPDKANRKYRAGRNTAIAEMKVLALLMKYAVRKNFAAGNPCRELGMKRDRPRRFPKYTVAHVQMIVDGIRAEPPERRAWLWPSFLLAWYHCVRLVETQIVPAKAVHLHADGDADTIIFRQKGGKVRAKPLHPELREFFQEILADPARGEQPLFEMPKSFAKGWHNFFKRCGLKTVLPKACFHSLRVTGNNRLRQAGIAKEIRKAYLSHDGIEDVNARYNRIGGDEDIDPDDAPDIDLAELRQCHAPLKRCWT